MKFSKLEITRKLTLSICIGLMAINTYAANPKQPSISFNNRIITQTADMGRAYTTSSNRTMVPLRMISETMGFAVKWDNKKQTATIQNAGKKVEIAIGSKSPKVNGKAKAIDAPAELKNGRTYVPVRFVSEALGAQVAFKNNVVYISTDGTIVIPNEVDVTSLLKVDAVPGKATYNNATDFKVLQNYLGEHQRPTSTAPVYVNEEGTIIFMVLNRDQIWDKGDSFDVQIRIRRWADKGALQFNPDYYGPQNATVLEVLRFYLPNGADKLYKIIDDGFNDTLTNEDTYLNKDLQNTIGSDGKKVILTFDEGLCVRISK